MQVCPSIQGGKNSCRSGACKGTCNMEGDTLCNGACVSTSNDMSNCGSCGRACAPQDANSIASCAGGQCTQTCKPGFTACGSACVDLATDTRNCGQCGRGCYDYDGDFRATVTCSNSQCSRGCEAAHPNQCGNNNLVSRSHCVSVQTDIDNCGSCGATCPYHAECIAGGCPPPPRLPDYPCPVNQRTSIGGPNGHSYYTCPDFQGVFCTPGDDLTVNRPISFNSITSCGNLYTYTQSGLHGYGSAFGLDSSRNLIVPEYGIVHLDSVDVRRFDSMRCNLASQCAQDSFCIGSHSGPGDTAGFCIPYVPQSAFSPS